jgi:biotin operon repressor
MVRGGTRTDPMPPDIPADVRQFLAEHIDSVGVLDVLLLLRAAPEKPWSAVEVGRALVTGETAAATHLERLRAHRLAVDVDGAYRYAPPLDQEATVDALAECFTRRRHTVIGLIYGGGERSATTLANAFRLRRRDV